MPDSFVDEEGYVHIWHIEAGAFAVLSLEDAWAVASELPADDPGVAQLREVVIKETARRLEVGD